LEDDDDVGGDCGTYGRKRNAYKVPVRNREAWRPEDRGLDDILILKWVLK
jgi:hypothetical protein